MATVLMLVIGMYNRPVSLRQQTRAAWSDIDAQLKRVWGPGTTAAGARSFRSTDRRPAGAPVRPASSLTAASIRRTSWPRWSTSRSAAISRSSALRVDTPRLERLRPGTLDEHLPWAIALGVTEAGLAPTPSR